MSQCCKSLIPDLGIIVKYSNQCRGKEGGLALPCLKEISWEIIKRARSWSTGLTFFSKELVRKPVWNSNEILVLGFSREVEPRYISYASIHKIVYIKYVTCILWVTGSHTYGACKVSPSAFYKLEIQKNWCCYSETPFRQKANSSAPSPYSWPHGGLGVAHIDWKRHSTLQSPLFWILILFANTLTDTHRNNVYFEHPISQSNWEIKWSILILKNKINTYIYFIIFPYNHTAKMILVFTRLFQ